MQSGYKYALEHGYDVAVQVDGDGQHKPEYLPEMLDALRDRRRGRHGLRLALPRRPRLQGADRPPRSATASSRSSCRAIIRQRVTDPTSGFRMVNRRGIELFARDYPHDYPEVEAILMLHYHRLRDPRGAGADERARLRRAARSTTRAAAYYMIKVLLALFVGLLRRRPDAFEGAPPPATGESRRRAAAEPSVEGGGTA